MPAPARIGAPTSGPAWNNDLATVSSGPAFDPAWRCPDHPGRTPINGRCTLVLGKDKSCARTAQEAPQPAGTPEPVDYYAPIRVIAERLTWGPEDLAPFFAGEGVEDGTPEALAAIEAFAAGLTKALGDRISAALGEER